MAQERPSQATCRIVVGIPGMPLRYRPNPELFDPRQHKAVHRGQAFLDACKFPALNQEGLEADTRGQSFYDIWRKMAAVR